MLIRWIHVGFRFRAAVLEIDGCQFLIRTSIYLKREWRWKNVRKVHCIEMKSSFNSCSASEFNIWFYSVTCYTHVGQQSNGRTQIEGVSQQGAERHVSTEARECIWLLWELMTLKCYKTWPGISDNKCTAAIENFREVVRDNNNNIY
jgi:hypothetical protein